MHIPRGQLLLLDMMPLVRADDESYVGLLEKQKNSEMAPCPRVGGGWFCYCPAYMLGIGWAFKRAFVRRAESMKWRFLRTRL